MCNSTTRLALYPLTVTAHDPPTTPLPLPETAGRIDPSIKTLLLFGGSFDPPHKGHVNLPLMAARHLEAALDEPKGVWIVYIPAARSPHKSVQPRASDAQRVEMLSLATAHLPRCAVWTDEIDRAAHSPGTPSYTIDTLKRLRASLDQRAGEDIRLRLLIGADQAAALERWREPLAISALAEPLVMARPGTDAGSFPASLGEWSRRLLPIPTLEASSTAVRDAIAASDSTAIKRLLDPQVAAYIASSGLYN